MKRYIFYAALAVALGLTLVFGPAARADEDSGERLVRKFFTDAKAKDVGAIEKTLAEGFQAAHTDGPRDRAGELNIVRTIKLSSYTLSNFKTTRNGPVMVVTFKVNAPHEVIEGKRVGDGSHERLAVWLKTNEGWQMIAYANLAPLKK